MAKLNKIIVDSVEYDVGGPEIEVQKNTLLINSTPTDPEEEEYKEEIANKLKGDY